MNRSVMIELGNLSPSAPGLHLLGYVYRKAALTTPLGLQVDIDSMHPCERMLDLGDYQLRFHTAFGTGPFTVQISDRGTGFVFASQDDAAGPGAPSFSLDFTVA